MNVEVLRAMLQDEPAPRSFHDVSMAWAAAGTAIRLLVGYGNVGMGSS